MKLNNYIPIYNIIDKRKEAEWEFIKFRGDAAVYAKCDHCDFIYGVYNGVTREMTVPYPYCPICGRRMKYDRYLRYKKVDSYPFL